MPGTVFVEIQRKTSGRKETLLEGRDYQVMYTNGVISLDKNRIPSVYQVRVTYSPALPILAYVKALSQSSFQVRVEELPLAAVNKNNITFPIKEEANIFKVEIPGEGVLKEGRVAQHLEGEVLHIKEGVSRLSQAGYALVSFTVETGALPLAPLVRYSNALTAGDSSKVWEGMTPEEVPLEINSIIKFYSRTNPSIKEYVKVKSKENIDGINTRVTFTHPMLKSSLLIQRCIYPRGLYI